MSFRVANRYAFSLFEAAAEKGIVEDVKNDLNLIGEILAGSFDLVVFLKSPIIKAEKKKSALEAVFFNKISPLTKSFITLLVDNGREEALQLVIKSFIKIYNERNNIIEIEVFSAHELADTQLKSLKSALEVKFQKKVILETKINPSLMGGIAIKYGDTIIDGTVKHKLEQLSETFEGSVQLTQ